ncbi:MAG TPA: oligosaccharide flippase family protein [Noviherbaspirillum sp.]|nr:oligosaccharide flippase family protein [Noviherbaspirillum sp.]
MRRDFFITALGIGIGQLIVLLATPFLVRIYTPGQFGQYASLIALSSVIATGASLRLDIALPALHDEEFTTISRLAFLLPVAVVPLICFLLPIRGLSAFSFFKGIESISLTQLWLVSCFQGMAAVAIGYCTRQGYFSTNAAIKILQPAIFVFTAMFWHAAGLENAVVISWIAAVAIGAIALSTVGWDKSWKGTLKAVTKKWEYPVISMPVAILDTMTQALPLLFIVSVFGEDTGGNYSQMQRLVAAPLLLTGVAISQVFYKHAGDLHRKNASVFLLLRKTVMALAMIGVILAIAVMLIGHPLMHLVLGDRWRTDTYFILLVLLPVVFRISVSPVTSIFLVCDRVALGAFWQVTYFFSTFAVLTLSVRRFKLDDFLLVFVASEFVMYSLYFVLADYSARNPRSKLLVG